ncbi:MAG: inositol monophosphatase family protein [bacterium]
MNRFLEERIKLAQELADVSGKVIRRYFRQGQIKSATKEGFVSAIVTVADQEAEDAMVALIRKKAPEDGIIREEGENVPSRNGHTWVLDPIDGTSSFVRGLPIFGTLIGFVREKDGATLLGVMNQPILKERWLGVRGKKTTLNGKPVKNPYATKKIALADVCLASTTPFMFITERQQRVAQKLQQACKRKAFGGDCYNYAAIASGWTSMPMIVLESDMAYYDFCPLIPIVQGAGGLITDWQGHPLTKDSREVLATPSKGVHGEVLKIIANVG